MSRLGLAVCLLLAAPTVASAHIHMLQPKSRTDNPTLDQKEQYCGVDSYMRANNPTRITTFKPGQKIQVMWRETVAHTGWYRIAFQPNGTVFSYAPPGPAPTNQPTVNQTGVTDATTGTMILLDRIADGPMGPTQMAEVTLPNIECNNCTLQFTQYMTDNGRAYQPGNNGSVYFNCADIVLSNTAPTTPDAGPLVDAGVDAGYPSDGSGVKGGCSTDGARGAWGFALIALVGLLARRRLARRS